MKKCPRCQSVKPFSDFPADRSKASGYFTYCKPCAAANSRESYARTNGRAARARYQADREKHKARKGGVKQRHGGPDEWARMFAEQDGKCYLCLQPLPEDCKDVHVDHDHSCCPGTKGDSRSCRYCRRGLTHQACNQVWGLVRENQIGRAHV